MRALIPQGSAGSLNRSGNLNNLVTLINCESLKEISEMACVDGLPSPLVYRLLTYKLKMNLKKIFFLSCSLELGTKEEALKMQKKKFINESTSAQNTFYTQKPYC